MKPKLLKGFLAGFFLFSCATIETPVAETRDYRDDMRQFIINMARYSREKNPDFLIIPQNGQELFTDTGRADGVVMEDYAAVLDGTGREDLNYGYEEDNHATKKSDRAPLLDLCLAMESRGIEVLVIDYCSDGEKMDDSYIRNEALGFIGFASPDRSMTSIPEYPPLPWGSSSRDITSLSEAANFLCLINDADYGSKEDFLSALEGTDYDVLIIDHYAAGEELTREDTARLSRKKDGGNRLVICYMSIGEAETYRPYWQSGWKRDPPTWLEKENPHWPENYKVKYWDPGWQEIIFGTPESYLDGIVTAGFHGVYLDIVDAFEYFEP